MVDFPDQCHIMTVVFVSFYLRFLYTSCKKVAFGVSSDLRFMPPHLQTQALPALLPPFSAWAKTPRNITKHEPYCTKESNQHAPGFEEPFADPGSPCAQQAIVQWQELCVAGLALPSTREFLAKPPLPHGEEHPQQKLGTQEGARHGSALASLT